MRDFSVLDHLEEGIQIINFEMKYVYLNKALLAEIKMEAEDIIGKKMNEKFPGIEQTEIYKEIATCIHDGKIRNVLNEFQFPDGKKTYYELKVQPIPEGAIIFSRDITRSKKGEQLLRETNRELERFAYLSAHSLKEPLKHIFTYSDLILSDYNQNIPLEIQDIAKNIQTKVEQALQLVDNLRCLSDIGDKKLSRTQFSMRDKIREVANLVSKEYKDLYIEFPEQDFTVFAFSSLVTLLLKNLFSNAARHGSGEIKFIVENLPNPIFCISNQTANIPNYNDMFQLSQQDSYKTNKSLGLAICKRVVEKHNGRIWSRQTANKLQVCFTLEGG